MALELVGSAGQPLEQGAGNEVLVAELSARYAKAAADGRLFSAYLSGATGLAAGNKDDAAAAASTNFALWNPNGSGKRLTLIKFFLAWHSGTPGAAGAIWHGGFDATSVSIAGTRSPGRHKVLSGPNSAGVYLAHATGSALTGGLAPSLIRPSALYFTATAPAAVSLINALEDMQGDLVLMPGRGWVPLLPTASYTTPVFSLGVTWLEDDE